MIILTNSLDVTADYLCGILQRYQLRYQRLDTDNCIERLSISHVGSTTTIFIDELRLEPEDISNIWYRRPERLKHEIYSNSHEGKFILDEWSESLESFFIQIPLEKWMNHPSMNVAASHKLDQLRVASKLGFTVPESLVTQNPNQLKSFFFKHKSKIITKPLSAGYIERSNDEQDSLIYTNVVNSSNLEELDDLPNCPTLFQEYIDKICDVRITVVDENIHAVKLYAADESGLQCCDIRHNNMANVRYHSIDLPVEISEKVNNLMKFYGLRFGAIDMAVSQTGEWVFFEINPNGQWAWLDLVGGESIGLSFMKSFKEQ